jgi:protein-arginine deiminase
VATSSIRWVLGAMLVLTSLGGAGCSESDEPPQASAGGTTTAGSTSTSTTGDPPAPTEPRIVLAVDASRDGVADPADPRDVEGLTEWTAERGAAFLANVDDDDSDGVRDCDDDRVNGEADAADLAPVVLGGWAEAPDGTAGTVTLDAASSANVRVFKKGADGTWTLILGSLGACTGADCPLAMSAELTTDELRAGVELGLEGRGFRVSLEPDAWDGMVELTYSLRDSEGGVLSTVDRPDGIARAKLRVAPWVLNDNLSAFDKLWSSKGSSEFVTGLKKAVAPTSLDYEAYSGWTDQWTQDYFQTAWTSIPGPNGTVRGMRVANPRPWSNGTKLPITWLQSSYLGPDRGIVTIYNKPKSGDTYDSHGNHEVIPPYTKGAERYPFGRILTGSGVLKETRAFYEAQALQAPRFRVVSSWLVVGHVDEFVSFVPASTPRGWKLLVASPKLARAMLTEQAAKGNGGAVMFSGKLRYGPKDNWEPTLPADVTIDEVLADVDLMQWSQDAQGYIDDARDDLQEEIGLDDDEIVEIPFLFTDEEGLKVAYGPGTVNMLVFGDRVVPPDPFGPEIDGADLFKQDLLDRLGTPKHQLGSAGEGLTVRFTDDWYTYHLLLGEVHCGTNLDAAPTLARGAWWEAGR